MTKRKQPTGMKSGGGGDPTDSFKTHPHETLIVSTRFALGLLNRLRQDAIENRLNANWVRVLGHSFMVRMEYTKLIRILGARDDSGVALWERLSLANGFRVSAGGRSAMSSAELVTILVGQWCDELFSCLWPDHEAEWLAITKFEEQKDKDWVSGWKEQITTFGKWIMNVDPVAQVACPPSHDKWEKFCAAASSLPEIGDEEALWIDVAKELERATGRVMSSFDDARRTNGSGDWSVPLRPSQLAKMFDCSPDTIKRMLQGGKVRHRKLSDRSYQIDLIDLPALYREAAAISSAEVSRIRRISASDPN